MSITERRRELTSAVSAVDYGQGETSAAFLSFACFAGGGAARQRTGTVAAIGHMKQAYAQIWLPRPGTCDCPRIRGISLALEKAFPLAAHQTISRRLALALDALGALDG